jgi:S1-C subfamily serine protease
MSIDFRSRLEMTVAALLGAGAIAGGIWYAGPKAPGRPVRTQASARVSAESRTITLPPTTKDVPMPTASPEPAPEAPVTRASSRDVPEPSAPPLEDVIERAMRGVVMIETQKSRGSGFFVQADLIVTNTHVISGSTFVSVTTQTGAKLPGRVAQVSDEADVALVQVGPPGLLDAQLPLGTSATLRLGQGIVALGWAQSLEQRTVARGIITGLRRVLDRPFLQTDAAPNPGDSGGPVMNRHGEVVGITTMRAEDGSAGYAVPIDDAKPLLARVTLPFMTIPSAGPGNAPASGAPGASGTPGGLVVGGAGDAAVQRETGGQQYATVLAGAAQRAADLDEAWTRYRASCRITDVRAGNSHEWFDLYDPRSPLHSTASNCARALNAFQDEADAINRTMLGAEEAARRADVYPGTRRDLRRRFRLDYSGWDR